MLPSFISFSGASLTASNTFTGIPQIVEGATTTGPDFEVRLTGDTISRVAIGLNITDVSRVSFGPGGASNRDLFLERAGAANLRLGGPAVDAGLIGQTISVQNALAGGTSNVAGANTTIALSQGKGTGIGGSLIIQGAPAGSTGTAVNALVNVIDINPTTLNVSSALTVSATSPSSSNRYTLLNSTGVVVLSGSRVGWASSPSDIGGAPDLTLFRDATGILAQRNANNGQILRVGYNFTDASNYSWAMIDAGQTTANTLGIGSRSVGSPGQKLTKLAVFVDGTNQLDFGVSTASLWTAAVGIDAAGSIRTTSSANPFVSNSATANRPVLAMNGSGNYGMISQLNANTWQLGYSASLTSGTAVIQWTDNGSINLIPNNSIVTLGGTTSSFPALKRSSTALQVRLADDSNYAPIAASAYSVGATAGASGGPFTAITSITVVNGIITAITGT